VELEMPLWGISRQQLASMKKQVYIRDQEKEDYRIYQLTFFLNSRPLQWWSLDLLNRPL